jgi:mono/diheme cytochrome c family protein
MRTPSLAGSFAVLTPVMALVGALAAALAGCRSLPPSKPAALWTAEEARGAQIYQLKCARCHYPTTTRGLHGPGLQALTKIKAMPSGAPPTDERLTQVILRGRLEMPATPLTDSQLSDLLAYLHSL